jgi:hypothetical protein
MPTTLSFSQMRPANHSAVRNTIWIPAATRDLSLAECSSGIKMPAHRLAGLTVRFLILGWDGFELRCSRSYLQRELAGERSSSPNKSCAPATFSESLLRHLLS